MKIYGLERDEIARAFDSGDIVIAVYGLGKIGLPLAAVFAENGANVLGVDVNENVVNSVNAGVNPIPEEPGLGGLVEQNVMAGRLCAMTDPVKAARQADIMVIIVPTLIDMNNNPDLSAVKAVCESIAKGLEKGDFVITESTLPPGATKNVVLPILEKSGLKCGEFGVAHCPERVSSGRIIEDITRAYPKIVGGVDEKSTGTAEAFYNVINKNGVIAVSDATTAEVVKVFEGIYRNVNIALANQLALVCEEIGVDAIEVFNAANTQPYSHLHRPGCGVGGHCIPVYPYFVIKTVKKSDTSLLELSCAINEGMPQYTVDKVKTELGEIAGMNVLVLGLTYKGGVKETRYSPGLAIVRLLKEEGADVFAYDPLLEREEVEQFGATYSNPETAKDIDAVIIATDHHEFRNIDWNEIGERMRNKVIVDGRQVVNPNELREKGFRCYAIGHKNENKTKK